MDSETGAASIKTHKYNKNIQANECVRPFKLRRHFPSTVTELNKNGIDKNPCIKQAKYVTNIVSALPDNMKFIPNKEVQPSEVQNVQKLTLKSINGKDLGEMNVTMHKKLQTKMITVPKIIEKSNRLKKSTEPVTKQVEGLKPKIKNISEIGSSLSFEENCKKFEEALFSNRTVQFISGEKKLAFNTTPNCSKQILVKNTGSEVKKMTPNIIFSNQSNQPKLMTMNRIPSFPKVLMVKRGNNQLVTPASDNFRQVSWVKKSMFNTQASKIDDDNEIVKTHQNNSSLKKRDGSFLNQSENIESKRVCKNVDSKDLRISQDFNKESSNKEIDESLEIKSFLNRNLCPSRTKKNIMVIVPNGSSKELTIASNSLNISNEDVLDDNNEIIFLHEKDTMESDNQNIEHLNDREIINSPNQEDADLSNNQDIDSYKSENLLDKFSILEKAVLSVQDDNLRAKALKALKDCGIKSKKKVIVKRPLPTKIINESAIQTNVFSLLKEGEFLEADEEHENLIKIKSSRKSPNQSMNSLDNITNNEICENLTEYGKNLDKMLDRIFQNNTDVSDIKNAFVQNKKLQAKYMLKKLVNDFEAARNYDNNGYLGIHKAVVNNNLQEVQKYIIILKAAKQNIDIYTEDGQTSLELAVELEVDPQIIKILLDNGAQPVSSKAVHNSALILAAKKSSRILPLLLQYISRSQKDLVNAKNEEGFAAIHYCSQFGNLVGITELIRHGAEVNIQDERSGRTPLFYAVDTKNSDVPQEVYNDIAQILVDNGAYSNIPTFSKHSVLSLIDDVKSHTLKIALNRAVR